MRPFLSLTPLPFPISSFDSHILPSFLCLCTTHLRICSRYRLTPSPDAVILDAGSSGTRIYVYQWDVTDQQPAVIKSDGWPDPKVEPGLSALPSVPTPANTPHTGLHSLAPEIVSIPDAKAPVHLSEQVTIYTPASQTAAATLARVRVYLDPLIAQARQFLPGDKLKSIPLFLMATGGMRRLKQQHHAEFLVLRAAVIAYLTTCGFGNAQYKTISGEDEALYGWVAVNYIDQRFRAAADTHGFMEMGGESAQFAVALQGPDYGGFTGVLRQVSIGGELHRVFVKTWLGLGGDSAWKRHEERLRESESAIPHDPCLPKEYAYRLAGTDKLVLGTADFVHCLKETFALLSCPDKKCLAGDLCIFRSGAADSQLSAGCLLKDPVTGQPFMTFDTKRFNGASVYWHAIHGIFGSRSGADDFATFWDDVQDLSALTWEQIRADKVDTESRFLQKAFFTAAMVMSTLFYGFGIPMPPDAITATRAIAVERATRSLALARSVAGRAHKKFKSAEAARVRSVARAVKAEKADIAATANVAHPALWPTEADAIACQQLYDQKPNEANRQDMIATMSWATSAADGKAKAAEAARAARVERANASILATETYSAWVKAKGQVRQGELLLERLPDVELVAQPDVTDVAVDDDAFQYTSVSDADWPLGRIVLHANSSGIDVRSELGWKPVVP